MDPIKTEGNSPQRKRGVIILVLILLLGAAVFFSLRGLNTNQVQPRDEKGLGIFTQTEVEADFRRLKGEGKYLFSLNSGPQSATRSDLAKELLFLVPSASTLSRYSTSTYVVTYTTEDMNVWEHYSYLANRLLEGGVKLTYGQRTPKASIMEAETPGYRVRILQSWLSENSAEVTIHIQAK